MTGSLLLGEGTGGGKSVCPRRRAEQRSKMTGRSLLRLLGWRRRCEDLAGWSHWSLEDVSSLAPIALGAGSLALALALDLALVLSLARALVASRTVRLAHVVDFGSTLCGHRVFLAAAGHLLFLAAAGHLLFLAAADHLLFLAAARYVHGRYNAPGGPICNPLLRYAFEVLAVDVVWTLHPSPEAGERIFECIVVTQSDKMRQVEETFGNGVALCSAELALAVGDGAVDGVWSFDRAGRAQLGEEIILPLLVAECHCVVGKGRIGSGGLWAVFVRRLL